jgi:hypothetical protein
MKESGKIKYKDNGILVNVRASSLKRLYEKYKDAGLFEQNFRYFVGNKRIDNNITKSLTNKRDDFWFLNNGIIIGCSDYTDDADNIKLYDFSIINGCQTTTLIGEYKGRNEGEDFVLPCKIVKPATSKGKNEDTFYSFISDIAESSNSQKPILDRDLKSNKHEQKDLQKRLKEEDPPVFLEIKRGDVSLRSKKLVSGDWQKISNDVLGQLILSFYLQQPGTARSSKKKIFADPNTYNKIFFRQYDKDGLIDLIKLNKYYKDFDNNTEYVTLSQQMVGSNGKFVVLAIIGFLLKHKRGLLKTKKTENGEQWLTEVEADNLKGPIFNRDYKDDDFH